MAHRVNRTHKYYFHSSQGVQAEDGRRERLGEYIHPELNQEIEFFGGNYSFLEEGKLSYERKEVLYLLGTAAVESSCCGRGGCAFIKVPGYVLSWKKGWSESGRPISEVERIVSEENQAAIRRVLQEKFPGFQQVEFL
jgi:hypothetical protein